MSATTVKPLRALFQKHQNEQRGFSGGSAVKNPPAMQETRVDPQVRNIPRRREWLPTPVFLPGESHGQRRLADYSPWGRKESDTTKPLSRTHSFTLISGPPCWNSPGHGPSRPKTPRSTAGLSSIVVKEMVSTRCPGVPCAPKGLPKNFSLTCPCGCCSPFTV